MTLICSCDPMDCVSLWNCQMGRDDDFGELVACAHCTKKTWVRVQPAKYCKNRHLPKKRGMAYLKCPHCDKETPVVGPGSGSALRSLLRTGKVPRQHKRKLPLLFAKEHGGDSPIWVDDLNFEKKRIPQIEPLIECFGNPTVATKQCVKCHKANLRFILNGKNRKDQCKQGKGCPFALTCISRSLRLVKVFVCFNCKDIKFNWFC